MKHIESNPRGWSRVLSVAAVLALGGPAHAAPDLRTVNASGEGRVEVSPDGVRVIVGLETQETTLGRARASNEVTFRRVVGAVKGLRLKHWAAKSDTLRVEVLRDHMERGKLPRVIGYRVFNSVTIRIDDRDAQRLASGASRIVDAVLGAGANQISSVTFLRQDTRAAYQEALRRAVDDARANAAMLAQRAKATLGRLRSLSPGWGSYYPTLIHDWYGGGGGGHYTQAARWGGSDSGTAIAAGKFIVRASITVVYDLQ